MPVCYQYLYSPAPLFFNRLIYFGIYVFYSEKQSYVTKRKNTEWYLVWVQHLLKRKHVGCANLWHSLSPSPAAVCNEGSCFGNYEQEEWKGMDSFLHFGTMLSVLHLVINSHGPFWKGSRLFSFFFWKLAWIYVQQKPTAGRLFIYFFSFLLLHLCVKNSRIF